MGEEKSIKFRKSQLKKGKGPEKTSVPSPLESPTPARATGELSRVLGDVPELDSSSSMRELRYSPLLPLLPRFGEISDLHRFSERLRARKDELIGGVSEDESEREGQAEVSMLNQVISWLGEEEG